MTNFSQKWFLIKAWLALISVGNVLKMLQMSFFWCIERPQKILIKKKKKNWNWGVIVCVLVAVSLPFPQGSEHIPPSMSPWRSSWCDLLCMETAFGGGFSTSLDFCVLFGHFKTGKNRWKQAVLLSFWNTIDTESCSWWETSGETCTILQRWEFRQEWEIWKCSKLLLFIIRTHLKTVLLSKLPLLLFFRILRI